MTGPVLGHAAQLGYAGQIGTNEPHNATMGDPALLTAYLENQVSSVEAQLRESVSMDASKDPIAPESNPFSSETPITVEADDIGLETTSTLPSYSSGDLLSHGDEIGSFSVPTSHSCSSSRRSSRSSAPSSRAHIRALFPASAFSSPPWLVEKLRQVRLFQPHTWTFLFDGSLNKPNGTSCIACGLGTRLILADAIEEERLCRMSMWRESLRYFARSLRVSADAELSAAPFTTQLKAFGSSLLYYLCDRVDLMMVLMVEKHRQRLKKRRICYSFVLDCMRNISIFYSLLMSGMPLPVSGEKRNYRVSCCYVPENGNPSRGNRGKHRRRKAKKTILSFCPSMSGLCGS